MDIANWRILHTPPTSGAWNMAVDETLLEAVIAKTSLPTLRLYSWNPACLSLGYSQPAADVDQTALDARGWELVRRPTGGRAILHTDELTYAVIAHTDEPRLSGGVLESYCRLAQALQAALQLLSLNANADSRYALPEGAMPNGAVCFEVPSNYEITVNGKKLIGSAQSRRGGGVLQHGSLPLIGDLARITQVLRFNNETERAQAAKRLLQHAMTVEEALGKVICWQTAAEAFEKGFSQALQIHFTHNPLSESEQKRAAELTVGKYSGLEWNTRF